MLMIAADNAEEVRIDEAKMTDKTRISSDIPAISLFAISHLHQL